MKQIKISNDVNLNMGQPNDGRGCPHTQHNLKLHEFNSVEQPQNEKDDEWATTI